MAELAARLRVGALLAAVACAVVALSAQPHVALGVEPAQLSTGQLATATVTVPVGVSVTISTDAPGVASRTVVGTGGTLQVTLGPFASTGDYRIIASEGTESALAPVQVAPGSGGQETGRWARLNTRTERRLR